MSFLSRIFHRKQNLPSATSKEIKKDGQSIRDDFKEAQDLLRMLEEVRVVTSRPSTGTPTPGERKKKSAAPSFGPGTSAARRQLPGHVPPTVIDTTPYGSEGHHDSGSCNTGSHDTGGSGSSDSGSGSDSGGGGCD